MTEENKIKYKYLLILYHTVMGQMGLKKIILDFLLC